MERWHLAISAYGSAQSKVDQLSRYIERNSLSRLIPVIHVEKKAGKNFFLFLGIQSDERGVLPDELRDLVKLLGNPTWDPIIPGTYESFDYSKIRKMVAGGITPHDYARRIAYRPDAEQAYENPLDLSGLERHVNQLSTGELEVRSAQFDKLLYWLSTVYSGTWPTFKNVCRALELDSRGVEARRILRRLRLLGHIELSPDASHWRVCPPSLIRVAGLDGSYFIVGQRCSQLLEQWRKLEQIEIETVMQPGAAGPPAVYFRFEAGYSTLLQQVPQQYSLLDAGSASRTLAEVLPAIDEWAQRLTDVQGLVPGLYETYKFVGNGFIGREFDGESGLYRLERPDTANSSSQTLFYDRENDRWLKGDWYGLRFLALRQVQECSADYGIESQKLVVPFTERWPEIYERALVLCSGLLPEQQGETLIFNSVPGDVGRQLASKLGVKLEEI